MNPNDQLANYLKSLAPDNDLDALHPEENITETVGGDSRVPAAAKALRKLQRGKELTSKEQFYIEAIILPGQRPVIDIKNDRYDKVGSPFNHLNQKAIRTVIQRRIPSIGRVELPDHPAPYGGTAFVVGDGLMMTNRHVAEIFATGLGHDAVFKNGQSAGVDFEKEINSEEEDAKVFSVTNIQMIHPYWDMALLKVEGLDDIDPLKLSMIDPGDMQQEDIAVIGYPAMDPRNRIDVQNEIFRGEYNVKRMQPGKIGRRRKQRSYGRMVNTVTHDASTLGGNSGSAILHANSGVVVALHFAGIYKDANFAVPACELARDRHVVDAGVHFEGTPSPATTPWDDLWGEEEKTVVRPQASSTQSTFRGGTATWTIPIEVSVRIGDVAAHGVSVGQSDVMKTESDDGITEKLVEPVHETDYSNRQGYDPKFLGTKLPSPTVRSTKVVAKSKDGEKVLDYHRFSLVMHKERRLAIYTACNIDGREHKREPEKGPQFVYSRKALGGMGKNDREKWFNDPRLADEHQLPNKFYDKDRKAFDKGHLVRRDDVAWGDTYKEVMFANGDTFHVTNCSPQVGKFNRSNRRGVWGKLENEVLKQAENHDEMYSVFCGPILDDSDPVFDGVDDDSKIKVRIPKKFWKIIVVNNDGDLEAYAFLLDQDLGDVDFDDERELTFDNSWKKLMISIEDLEEEIGLLKFPKTLKDADQFDAIDAGAAV